MLKLHRRIACFVHLPDGIFDCPVGWSSGPAEETRLHRIRHYIAAESHSSFPRTSPGDWEGDWHAFLRCSQRWRLGVYARPGHKADGHYLPDVYRPLKATAITSTCSAQDGHGRAAVGLWGAQKDAPGRMSPRAAMPALAQSRAGQQGSRNAGCIQIGNPCQEPQDGACAVSHRNSRLARHSPPTCARRPVATNGIGGVHTLFSG